MKSKIIIFASLCFFTTFSLMAQNTLKLQKYLVSYKVKNAGFNTTGRFDKLSAQVVFDENALDKSTISATIETNSFNSGMTMRDNHVKNKDYFDVQNYPTMTLVSTKIEKKDKGYLGTFNLTIKGNTKSVQLPFTVIKNGNNLEFQSLELNIDRTIYGIGKPHFSLSSTVRITINATFTN